MSMLDFFQYECRLRLSFGLRNMWFYGQLDRIPNFTFAQDGSAIPEGEFDNRITIIPVLNPEVDYSSF